MPKVRDGITDVAASRVAIPTRGVNSGLVGRIGDEGAIWSPEDAGVILNRSTHDRCIDDAHGLLEVALEERVVQHGVLVLKRAEERVLHKIPVVVVAGLRNLLAQLQLHIGALHLRLESVHAAGQERAEAKQIALLLTVCRTVVGDCVLEHFPAAFAHKQHRQRGRAGRVGGVHCAFARPFRQEAGRRLFLPCPTRGPVGLVLRSTGRRRRGGRRGPDVVNALARLGSESTCAEDTQRRRGGARGQHGRGGVLSGWEGERAGRERRGWGTYKHGQQATEAALSETPRRLGPRRRDSVLWPNSFPRRRRHTRCAPRDAAANKPPVACVSGRAGSTPPGTARGCPLPCRHWCRRAHRRRRGAGAGGDVLLCTGHRGRGTAGWFVGQSWSGEKGRTSRRGLGTAQSRRTTTSRTRRSRGRVGALARSSADKSVARTDPTAQPIRPELPLALLGPGGVCDTRQGRLP